jgi:hypothetical protein
MPASAAAGHSRRSASGDDVVNYARQRKALAWTIAHFGHSRFTTEWEQYLEDYLLDEFAERFAPGVNSFTQKQYTKLLQEVHASLMLG